MRLFFAYSTFCFSLLFLGCAKDTTAPDTALEEAAVPITEITAVHYSNVTTDTVWVKMDALEMNFDTPVTHLDLGNIFDDVKDSIQIDIQLPSTLVVDQELLLPDLHIAEPYVWFNTKNDVLSVGGFPYDIGFHSQQRSEIKETLDGLISKITIDRKYQRIYYRADVQVVLLDKTGSSHNQEGAFVGSKMGNVSSDIQVW